VYRGAPARSLHFNANAALHAHREENTMQYRRLGSSGLQLSALSFGAWVTFGTRVGRSQARELIAMAWDHGINFFDNAETYANGEAERVMGDVLVDLRLPRDGWCVSSKVFFGASRNPGPTQRGLSRKHVVDGCHDALKRLRVDYLDLYYCHRPDPETPIAETVWAMDGLIRQGKVLYWGTSEWSAEQIRQAHAVAIEHGLHAPTMEQPQYNLLHRERVEIEYASLYEEFGMGATIWSPLASGLLTGKYNSGIPANSRLGQVGYEWLRHSVLGDAQSGRVDRARRFTAIAAQLGVAPAALAIAWCLRNPNVSCVLLGATRTEQLLQNLEALEVAERIDEAGWFQVEIATR
jgi:voltage-dependent potassium channel beta subunit